MRLGTRRRSPAGVFGITLVLAVAVMAAASTSLRWVVIGHRDAPLRRSQFGGAAISGDGQFVASVMVVPACDAGPPTLESRANPPGDDLSAELRVSKTTDLGTFSGRETIRTHFADRVPGFAFYAIAAAAADWFAVVDPAGGITLSTWELADTVHIATGILPMGDEAVGIALDATGSRLAVYGATPDSQGVIAVYNARTGAPVWRRPLGPDIPNGAAFSPDGDALAWTVAQRGRGVYINLHHPAVGANVFVADAATGEPRIGFDTGDLAAPIAFGSGNRIYTVPAGHGLSVQERTDKLSVWSALTGQRISTYAIPHRDIHDHMTLAVNGSIIVADVSNPPHNSFFDSGVSFEAAIAAWDTHTGKLLGPPFVEKDGGGLLYPMISTGGDMIFLADAVSAGTLLKLQP